MSQGAMRKPQPFTVGTRLSIPDSPTSGHYSAPADSHSMAQKRVPGTVHCAGPGAGLPGGHFQDPQDCLARSVRKIALSRQGEGGNIRTPGAIPSHLLGNINNNNNRGLRHLSPKDIQWEQPERGTSSQSPSSPGKVGDQLMREEAPGGSQIRAQLQTLRDQWQLLKQTATNHSKAEGGAKALQEFNKKADELEIWMREKEENPPLSFLLEENLDRVQVTRRILDLKQEQLYYRNLQEELNSLSQKLEKQHAPADGRSTANRRKHLNRMWLRLEAALDDHHRSLQLALEAAALGQQADTLLRAMEEAGSAAGDQELRDIASQIMLLDVTASRVSSLHPALESRVLQKQRQVKEVWLQLQHKARSGRWQTPGPLVGTVEQSILGSQAIVSQTAQRAETPPPATPPPCRETVTGGSEGSPEDGEQRRAPVEGPRPHSPPTQVLKDGAILGELSSASRWLQSLEQLLSEPAAMRSPELLRRDLRRASALEKELKSRSLALHSANREARSRGRAANQETRSRIQEVEERFQVVQEALRRRVSDLQDTLVLSEFMKVVQMEEDRRKREAEAAGACIDPPDPPGRVQGSAAFTPLEELQEAMEMLNDAAKERERVVAASRGSSELEGQLPVISQMIGSARSRLQELRQRMEEVEGRYMEVKKLSEVTCLEEIQQLQQQLEAEVSGELEAQVTRVQSLCPRVGGALSGRTEEMMGDWKQLQDYVQENRQRLRRTCQLRTFVLGYLRIISWTNETRAQILSENPEEGLSAAWRRRMDQGIQTNMRDFEELAGIGWELIGEERSLTHGIRDHLEELQGMLSWVLMRWRCQKQPRMMGNKLQAAKEDPAPAALRSEEFECPEEAELASAAPRGPRRRRYRRKALSPMLFQAPPPRPPSQGAEVLEEGAEVLEEGAEVLEEGAEVLEEGAEVLHNSPRKCSAGPRWLEPKVMPTGAELSRQEEEPEMLAPPPSFWKRCQGIIGSLKRKKRLSLPLAEEVSTYLRATPETRQTLTAPRPPKKAPPPDLPPNDPSSNRSSFLFGSLKRKDKAQRHTVQGIMGVCPNAEYETSTWPPKPDRSSPPQAPNYVQNPLTRDIDDECGTSVPGQEAAAHRSGSGRPLAEAGSPRVAIGSVLTLELTKEAATLPDSIQATLRIVPAQDDPSPSKGDPLEAVTVSPARAWIEALTSSPGYCRQNIHGYGRPADPEELRDDFISFEIERLSPIEALPLLEPQNVAEAPKIAPAYQVTQCGGASTLFQNTATCADPEPFKYDDSYVEFFSPYTRPTRTNPPNYPANHLPEKRSASRPFPEVLHPDQELLEHDDQELEDIWNKAKKGRLGSPQKKPHPVTLKGQTGGTPTAVTQGIARYPPPPAQGQMEGTLTAVTQGIPRYPPPPAQGQTGGTLTAVTQGIPRYPPPPAQGQTGGTPTAVTQGIPRYPPPPAQGQTGGTPTAVTQGIARYPPPPAQGQMEGTLTAVTQGIPRYPPPPAQGQTEGTPTAVTQGTPRYPPPPAQGQTEGTPTAVTQGTPRYPPPPAQGQTGGTPTAVTQGIPRYPPPPAQGQTEGTPTAVTQGTPRYPPPPAQGQTEGTPTAVTQGTTRYPPPPAQGQTGGTPTAVTQGIPRYPPPPAQGQTEGTPTAVTQGTPRYLPPPAQVVMGSEPNTLVATFTLPVTAAFSAELGKDQAKNEAEEDAARKEAEEAARRGAEDAARNEAEDATQRGAEDAAQREAEDATQREAEDAAQREAEDAVRNEAKDAAWRGAEDAAWRESEKAAWRGAEKAAWRAAGDPERSPGSSPAEPNSTPRRLPAPLSHAATPQPSGPRKLDFQLMEGTLERKHLLQPGGKKASCRTWGTFYAVLVRRTLCFYHHRKHAPTKQSTACAPPLHLTGARCTPEPDYTKRDNCFRLRLTDGSEYLFRTPSTELLHHWTSRLRHNSGLEDGDLLLGERDPLLTSQVTLLSPWVLGDGGVPFMMTDEHKQPIRAPAGGSRADAYPRTFVMSEEPHMSPAASRRRSRSFSSVTYQRIGSSLGQQEAPPSYSVTLYLEEPLTPRGRCHSLAAPPPRSHPKSPPPPPGKSVFRKLFWKKEGSGYRV